MAALLNHATVNRRYYLIAALLVIALGLASRRYADLLPGWLGKYPGDALWALMVTLLIAAVVPRWRTSTVAILALLIAFAVEFSQLYRAPWIDGVRSTTLGHLIMGSGFDGFDLVAYVIGVGIGFVLVAAYLYPRQASRHRVPD